MTTVSLDSQITSDPRTSQKVRLIHTVLDHMSNIAVVHFALVGPDGNDVAVRSERFTGPAVQAWVEGREDNIVSLVLGRLGVTGTKDP